MSIPRYVFAQLAEIVLSDGAKKATKFISPREVVKATFQGRRNVGRNRARTILFTVGAPNYAERKFIRLCEKAGEKFPIRKYQIRWA
jgi:hypothetical protein